MSVPLPAPTVSAPAIAAHAAWPLGIGAAIAAAAWALVAWGRAHQVESAELIVVLGAKVRDDGTPSPALARRIHAAAQLWQTTPSARIIATGHRGEAACVARELVARGVPPEQVIVEPHASNTLENALFTAPLARGGRVTMVTDDFHVLRSMQLFRRHHGPVAAHSVSAPTFPWRSALRELGSLMTQWARR